MPVSHSVAEIASWVDGTVKGDPNRQITAAVPLDEADATSVTFISNPRKLGQLTCRAIGALLISPDSTQEIPQVAFPLIIVDKPLTAMLTIAARFAPPVTQYPAGIDPRAAVDPSAELASDCYVGPFAVIEADVKIGPRCKIHPHAVIRSGCSLEEDVEVHPHAVLYPRCKVEARTIIHSGAVIGCDGYGYLFKDGRHVKVPQIGTVHIGQDVEIGANSTIDRATFGTTRVGNGTKIDNQVMVGHNCQIGQHNLLISQVGIAGSCVTGDYVTIAGQAGIADHVHIGDRVTVGAGAGVHTDLEAGKAYLGSPARPERDAKRYFLSTEKLPEMRKQLQEVRQHLGLDRPERRAAG